MATDRPFVKPIKPIRTFEAAIEQIVEGIESSGLRAGDRLPDEGELAAQLEISKPTLRQALRLLESPGVIEVRRGKGGGIFLRSELIPRGVISGAIAIEEDAMVDTLRARRVFETAVVELAMLTATEDDFREIERTNELLRESLDDRERAVHAGEMFHRAVVRACHNNALLDAWRSLVGRAVPVRDSYPRETDHHRRALAIHERQLDAMRAGDHTPLRLILEEHFRLAEEPFAQAIGRSWEELFVPPRLRAAAGA